MLKKTVYFRTQEDLDAFNAIDNKAEWLSHRLHDEREYQRYSNTPEGSTVEVRKTYNAFVSSEPDIPTTAVTKGFPGVPDGTEVHLVEDKSSMFDRDIQFCKHNNVKGSCKLGCK